MFFLEFPQEIRICTDLKDPSYSKATTTLKLYLGISLRPKPLKN